MPIDAEDLLGFAKDNCRPDASEACRRAATSRAYYAAYHWMLAVVSKLPREPSEGKSYLGHEDVEIRLSKWRVSEALPQLHSLAPVARNRAQLYRLARLARVKADYNIGADVTLPDVQQQVMRVEQLKRFVSEALSRVNSQED